MCGVWSVNLLAWKLRRISFYTIRNTKLKIRTEKRHICAQHSSMHSSVFRIVWLEVAVLLYCSAKWRRFDLLRLEYLLLCYYLVGALFFHALFQIPKTLMWFVLCCALLHSLWNCNGKWLVLCAWSTTIKYLQIYAEHSSFKVICLFRLVCVCVSYSASFCRSIHSNGWWIICWMRKDAAMH